MYDIGCTHLHISTVELGQLSIRGRDGTGGLVGKTLKDGASKVVRGNLDVLVGNDLLLFLSDLDAVNAKGPPKRGFKRLVRSLDTVRVGVVTQTERQEFLAAKREQLGEEIPGGLVVVTSVLRARPVVRVTHTKDGNLSFLELVGRRKLGERLGELSPVEGRFTLTSGRSNDENVLFLSKGPDDRAGNLIEDTERSTNATHLGSANKSLGKLLGVTTVTGVENEKTGAVERVEEGIVSLPSLLLPGSEKLGTGGGGYARVDSGCRKSKLREVRLSVKELGEGSLDVRRVERESLVVRKRGVPPEHGPPATRDGSLSLTESLKRAGVLAVRDSVTVFLFTPGQVGKDQTGSRVVLGFAHGVENTRVVGVHGDGSNVDVPHVEGVEGKVLLALFGRLGGSIGREGRSSGLVNEEVNVETRGKSMVKTRRSKVDSPRVGNHNPKSSLLPMALLTEFNNFLLVTFTGTDSSLNLFTRLGCTFLLVANQKPGRDSLVNLRFGVGGLEDLLGKLDEPGTLLSDGNGLTESVKRRSRFIGSEVRGVIENLERRRGRSKKLSVGRLGGRHSDGVRGDIVRKRLANSSDRGVTSDGGSDLLGRGRSTYQDGSNSHIGAFKSVDNRGPSRTVLAATSLNNDNLLNTRERRAELFLGGRDGKNDIDRVLSQYGGGEEVDDKSRRFGLIVDKRSLRSTSEFEERKADRVIGGNKLSLSRRLRTIANGDVGSVKRTREPSLGVLESLDFTLKTRGDKVIDHCVLVLSKTKGQQSVVISILRRSTD